MSDVCLTAYCGDPLLQDMRADLLTAEQEKELAAMVQDLLMLEEKQRELAQALGRLPTEIEWMEAVGVGPQGTSAEEHDKAVHAFHSRLTHGRTAKQVRVGEATGGHSIVPASGRCAADQAVVRSMTLAMALHGSQSLLAYAMAGHCLPSP